jgi:hypothetical protein
MFNIRNRSERITPEHGEKIINDSFKWRTRIYIYITFIRVYDLTTARAIAKAVSRWLPTAAARVRAQVWQVGFVVDKVASGQVFSEYFGFPCQNRSFHELLHHHNHPGQLAETLRRADHQSKDSYRLS